MLCIRKKLTKTKRNKEIQYRERFKEKHKNTTALHKLLWTSLIIDLYVCNTQNSSKN